MDLFRRLLGLPPRHGEENIFRPDQGGLHPGQFPTLFDEQHRNTEENFSGKNDMNDQMEMELREIEQHFKDMWNIFAMGSQIFNNEGWQNIFGGAEMSELPQMLPPGDQQSEEEGGNLRRQMLKPSLSLEDSRSPQIRQDVDLDSRVKAEGLSTILDEQQQQPLPPPQSVVPSFKSFSRSIRIQTVTRPDGTTETRRVMRDSDGNEEITVTEHPPGSNHQHPLFGTPLFPGPPQRPALPDQGGFDILGKLFGPRF